MDFITKIHTATRSTPTANIISIWIKRNIEEPKKLENIEKNTYKIENCFLVTNKQILLIILTYRKYIVETAESIAAH